MYGTKKYDDTEDGPRWWPLGRTTVLPKSCGACLTPAPLIGDAGSECWNMDCVPQNLLRNSFCGFSVSTGRDGGRAAAASL